MLNTQVLLGSANPAKMKPRGFLTTGVDIVKKETALGLYKGLGAVLGGIIPKMAIRFTSYEQYKQFLSDKETGKVTSKATFLGRSRPIYFQPSR